MKAAQGVDAEKTFVGFGFGPIQSGLMLFEANASGNFRRFVVAEIDAELVAAVRSNGGRYTVNVASSRGIDRHTVEGVELFNPTQPDERQNIIEAVAEADEMATCLPSVEYYQAGGPTSAAGMIAEGLRRRRGHRPAILYAAENHNRAAEILTGHLANDVPPDRLAQLQALNTVIGKMSGVITDPCQIERIGLATITPTCPRAVLVEQFNRILISSVTWPDYHRGIDVFIEKDDLLPFEEAKLYGHNAVHALIAYLADLKGLDTMVQAGRDENIMRIARQAFLDESGAALIRRHQGLNDSLFTPEGYRDYADDLLQRMVNPFLNDQVRRGTRDTVRKLGYEDRLYGTMRLAIDYGLTPRDLALGAAAAVVSMIKRRDDVGRPVPHLPACPDELTKDVLDRLLRGLWGEKIDRHATALIDLTWGALDQLQAV